MYHSTRVPLYSLSARFSASANPRPADRTAGKFPKCEIRQGCKPLAAAANRHGLKPCPDVSETAGLRPWPDGILNGGGGTQRASIGIQHVDGDHSDVGDGCLRRCYFMKARTSCAI
jgi:hypothetical protein